MPDTGFIPLGSAFQLFSAWVPTVTHPITECVAAAGDGLTVGTSTNDAEVFLYNASISLLTTDVIQGIQFRVNTALVGPIGNGELKCALTTDGTTHGTLRAIDAIAPPYWYFGSDSDLWELPPGSTFGDFDWTKIGCALRFLATFGSIYLDEVFIKVFWAAGDADPPDTILIDDAQRYVPGIGIRSVESLRRG